jgi:hypothetical protein
LFRNFRLWQSKGSTNSAEKSKMQSILQDLQTNRLLEQVYYLAVVKYGISGTVWHLKSAVVFQKPEVLGKLPGLHGTISK